MKKTLGIIITTITIGAIVATGCGATDDARTTAPAANTAEQGVGMTTISGELAYRERIALIPGGTATITLLDTSLQDVAATVIAEMVIELDDQQIPIPFELVADTTSLDARGTYSLRATIAGPGDDLQWTTDTANQIDVSQAEVNVGTLLMVRAGEAATDAEDASSAPIVGEWTVISVDGTDVVTGSAAMLVFGADGNLGGNTGCNSFSATYTTDADTVTVDTEIAMTLMACDGSIAVQETAFLRVLGAMETFEIGDDGVLTVTSSEGAEIIAER